jgi:ribulose-5-phosphate 4-epimerase/fuculose-1-phosphate aldolase
MSSVLESVQEKPWTPPRVQPEWNPDPIAGLTPKAEIAIALRILHSRGYDDNYFGHITVGQPDGTLLTNPWEVIWDQLRASDILTVDMEGRKIEGRYSPSPAISLHLAVKHYAKDPNKARVVLHQHPRYATLWAMREQAPPIYDQGGSWVDSPIYVVPEFSAGDVVTREHGEGITDCGWALLSDHGVLVLGSNLVEATWRASVLEYRSRRAHELEGRPGATPMDAETAQESANQIKGLAFTKQWWDAEVHRQVRMDPSVLS